jgi:nitroreductase
MDAYDCVATKLDIREFDPTRNVPAEVKLKVLEAGRLTSSGMNTQEWRFILVQDRENISKLAQDSTTGRWVASANFAVIVLTDPKYGYHMIDAGRATQDMMLAAWNYGVASGIFTGVNQELLRRDFNIPREMNPTVMIGFGYPKRAIKGRKKRRSQLSEVAFIEKYGNRFESGKVK